VTSEELEDYLSQVVIGPRERGRITIADYDEAWPDRFDEQHARIASAIGRTAHRIEHIGSTSVTGLAAKPIIDVLVAVSDVDSEDSYVSQLEAAGYILRIREPGHRMLRTPDAGVHVHIWPLGSNAGRRKLLFRDWLRNSREDREAYEALKRQLAKQDWNDRGHYTEAKSALVAEILHRAEAWAADIGWSEDDLGAATSGHPHMTAARQQLGPHPPPGIAGGLAALRGSGGLAYGAPRRPASSAIGTAL
jgi:GrpB-like predicted nucleotidyltransferase (UPF0157 family)